LLPCCGLAFRLAFRPSTQNNPPAAATNDAPPRRSPTEKTKQNNATKTASERKLLLLIRHGQAVSNFLSDALGPDEWFGVEGTCTYDPKNGSEPLRVFDADLTALGRDQALALNSMLRGGGWWPRLTGGHAARAVVSPLTRCLNTATLALGGLEEGRVEAGGGGVRATVVEEFVRETLGEDTCDARRSASDPPPAPASASAAASSAASPSSASFPSSEDGGNGLTKGGKGGGSSTKGPCKFERGLRTLFPAYTFDVVDDGGRAGGLGRGGVNATRRARAAPAGGGSNGLDGQGAAEEGRGDDDGGGDDRDPVPRPLGLVSDADTLWTKGEREQQKHQVRRARAFLDILFARAEERVAVVVTHSGFARSLLLAVEREPYRPVNAELVPVIVDRRAQEEEEGEEGEDDWEEEEGAEQGAGGGEQAGEAAAATAGAIAAS